MGLFVGSVGGWKVRLLKRRSFCFEAEVVVVVLGLGWEVLEGGGSVEGKFTLQKLAGELFVRLSKVKDRRGSFEVSLHVPAVQKASSCIPSKN